MCDPSLRERHLSYKQILLKQIVETTITTWSCTSWHEAHTTNMLSTGQMLSTSFQKQQNSNCLNAPNLFYMISAFFSDSVTYIEK